MRIFGKRLSKLCGFFRKRGEQMPIVEIQWHDGGTEEQKQMLEACDKAKGKLEEKARELGLTRVTICRAQIVYKDDHTPPLRMGVTGPQVTGRPRTIVNELASVIPEREQLGISFSPSRLHSSGRSL
jgi:hypothetical protein